MGVSLLPDAIERASLRSLLVEVELMQDLLNDVRIRGLKRDGQTFVGVQQEVSAIIPSRVQP